MCLSIRQKLSVQPDKSDQSVQIQGMFVSSRRRCSLECGQYNKCYIILVRM